MERRNHERQAAAVLLLVLLFLYSPQDCPGQAGEVDAIEINSTWGGLGPSSKSRLTIKRKKNELFPGGNSRAGTG